MLAAMLSVLLFGSGESDLDRRQRDIDTIRLTYQANKESFSAGEFHFTQIQGRANSVEEAKQGTIEKPIISTGYYVFKGRMSRYERDVPIDVFLANSKEGANGRMSVSVIPCRLLCNREVTLYDSPAPQTTESGEAYWGYNPQITPGMTFYDRHYKFPLHIGNTMAHYYDLYADLTDTLSQGELILKEVRIDEGNMAYVSLEAKIGTREYWLDLNRGAIPTKIHDYYYDGKRIEDIYYDEIVEVKGKGFFPKLTCEIFDGGRRVDLLRIDSYNVDSIPPDSSFALSFPKAIGLLDVPKSLQYSPRKSWSLMNLPKAGSKDAVKFVLPSSSAEPEMPLPIESAPVFPKYAGVMILVFVAAILWWLGGKRWRGTEAHIT